MTNDNENLEVKDEAKAAEDARLAAKEAKAKEKKKKKMIQTACIAGGVVLVVVIILLLAGPVAKLFNKAVAEEAPEGYKTYNASRFFFRFNQPEDWKVKTDSSGFGFLQDGSTGLVATLLPPASATDIEANTGGNDVGGEDEEIEADINAALYSEDAMARFYYRGFKEGQTLDTPAAFNAFAEEMRAGLLATGAELVDIKIGEPASYSGDNETFYSATVEYKVKKTVSTTVTTEDGAEEQQTEVTEISYKGTVYVSARSMAYCAIAVTYDVSKAEFFKTHEKNLVYAVDSFRFSVFED